MRRRFSPAVAGLALLASSACGPTFLDLKDPPVRVAFPRGAELTDPLTDSAADSPLGHLSFTSASAHYADQVFSVLLLRFPAGVAAPASIPASLALAGAPSDQHWTLVDERDSVVAGHPCFDQHYLAASGQIELYLRVVRVSDDALLELFVGKKTAGAGQADEQVRKQQFFDSVTE